MKATIIIIGDEVLLGRVTDTNSGDIARAIEPSGFSVDRIITIHDNPDTIRRTVCDALKDSPLVITTGGLGPTKDDMTKAVLCDIFGGTLVHDPSVLTNIRRIFAGKGLALNPLTEQQAMVPSSCRVINNPAGTAPVMWFEDAAGHVLVSLPGVPGEVRAVLGCDGGVIENISTRFAPDRVFAHRTAIVTGISESALATHLDRFETDLADNLHLAYLPYSPIIKLRLDAHGTDSAAVETEADKAFSSLCALCKNYLIACEDITPAEILLARLARYQYTVGTAESCTGGNIAAALTAIPGSSAHVMGGIVAYDNSVKHNILDVPDEVLATHGAVSRETVTHMLAGACRALGTDCSIATSGIAGPGGGTPEKPVGTVWIGARTPDSEDIECLHLRGSRRDITARATTMALLKLISLLEK